MGRPYFCAVQEKVQEVVHGEVHGHEAVDSVREREVQVAPAIPRGEVRIGLRLTKGGLGWEASSSMLVMEKAMIPVDDCPEFDESFRQLIAPSVRISWRQR